MPTTVMIADIITDTLMETERLLLADANLDYANAKARAIALAKYEVYGSEVAEASISNLSVKQYLAYLALRDRIIPAAIDWLMHKGRLSDVKEGATFSYYDRVAALQAQLAKIEAWLNSHKEQIVGGAGEVIDISTLDAGTRKATYKLLDDPWTLAEDR